MQRREIISTIQKYNESSGLNMADLTSVCGKLKDAIADEIKGIDEYRKMIEDVKELPSKDGVMLFSVLQEIKTEEEKHALMLTHLKEHICESG